MSKYTLAIFMSVGAAAGLAAGLLLMDITGGEITHVDGLSISIATDKSDYKLGEPVSVRIVNTGSVPLESGEAWRFRITGLSGMLMYSEPGHAPAKLDPGLETTLVWDQTKNDGDTALEGLYRISIRGHGPDGAQAEDSTTIMIWK